MLKRAVMLFLWAAFAIRASERPGDWTGNYLPCDGHAELLKRQPMNLGVRFSTSNRKLAVEFARAMDFWATVLDMDWREEDSRDCALQIVDGYPGLFKRAEVARAQFPGTLSFQGWIAFNTKVSLSASELFSMAVHEVGHVLGLQHSTNPSSAMYFVSLDRTAFLDRADLAALASHHRLRARVTPAALAPVVYQCH